MDKSVTCVEPTNDLVHGVTYNPEKEITNNSGNRFYKIGDKWYSALRFIPTKWCIKRTPDNFRVINMWMNAHTSKHYPEPYSSDEGWVRFPDTDADVSFVNKPKNFDPITYEDFTKLTTIKNTEMAAEKKIKGWVIKDEKYKEAAEKVVGGKFAHGLPVLTGEGSWYNEFLDLGVLDLWFKPVYEENETIIIVGDRKIPMVIGANKIIADGKQIPFTVLEGLHSTLNSLKQLPWDVKLELDHPLITIGCSKFSLKELDLIISTYKKYNK